MSSRRATRRRFIERLALFTAAVATTFSVIAAILGYIDVGTPMKGAGVPLAIGIGYWVYRAWISETGFWLPNPWKAAVVVLACLLVATTLVWREAIPDRKAQYEFVVVPHKGEFVFESLAPQPDTEIFPGRELEYGNHLSVTCYTEVSEGHVWLRLLDRNFLSSQDLKLAPFS